MDALAALELDVDPVTNKICYVATLTDGVTVINGATNATNDLNLSMQTARAIAVNPGDE